jgi:anti-anti-sigma factor
LFDVRTADRNGWSLATVVGDLDLATLPALRTALDQLEGRSVGLDLTGVAYLDAVVLGVVLGARVRARRLGGDFVVVCPPGGARDLLAATGVDAVLNVVASLDELESAQ